MHTKRFAYLHSHTKYSIKDAMPDPADYVDAIYKYNQAGTDYECVGLAITDHGNISALPYQNQACVHPSDENKKIHPIFGFEAYHCIDVDNNPNKDRFHLILLAKNDIGLKNIYQIASHGGMHILKGSIKDFPITDLQYMKSHGKGIVCLTACVAGLVPSCIINGEEQKALSYIQKFRSIFDDVFLEVQPYDFPEQLLVNDAMVRLSSQTGLKLVMTCDSHYINASDKQYHDILKDISHQKPFTTNNYLRTPEEMEDYCKQYNIPLECITNTAIVSDMCQVDPIPKDHRALLPIYPCPEGYDEASYLRELCFIKLKEKLADKKIKEPQKYLKEMLYELDVICNAGFAGYFLILWDWFSWCRKNDILMGPGRGSAAGSIVSYCLDITKVDPIKNGFYFERFISPERLSFPDCDSDIPRDKRAKGISYLLSKYGEAQVSQIVTFTYYKLKNTMKAILSKQGCPIEKQNQISKAIPDLVDGKAVTLDFLEDFHNNPDKYGELSNGDRSSLEQAYKAFDEACAEYPQTYDAVKHVAGCISTTGIHAGGVIICNKPIAENGQIMQGSKTAVLPVLQFDMVSLDYFGFLN